MERERKAAGGDDCLCKTLMDVHMQVFLMMMMYVLVRDQVVMNVDVDPSLVIARLQQQVWDLQDELRSVTG